MTMIEAIASTGLPSHEGPGFGTPSASRNQLSTLKAGSRIHIQATVLRTVGTMNGKSSNARIRFFSGNCWFIAKASARPPTIFSNVATAV